MEVINPVIIMGGQKEALLNQAQSEDIVQGRAAYDHKGNLVTGALLPSTATVTEAQMMLSTFAQVSPLYRYSMAVTIPAPALYILRPGAYTLNNHEFNPDLLQQYGLGRGEFKRLVISGYLPFTDRGTSINFCGVYDKSKSADFMRCYCYIADTIYERSLPIIQGEQGKAAIPFAAIYALYCDAELISLDDIRKNWQEYTTLDFFYMFLEE